MSSHAGLCGGKNTSHLISSHLTLTFSLLTLTSASFSLYPQSPFPRSLASVYTIDSDDDGTDPAHLIYLAGLDNARQTIFRVLYHFSRIAIFVFALLSSYI